MIIKKVSYGRTIDVGHFGRGPHARIWFGYEAELQGTESEQDVLKELQKLASAQEAVEQELFAERCRLKRKE